MTGAHRRIHGRIRICKLTDGQIASEDTRLALAVAALATHTLPIWKTHQAAG